MINAYGIEGKVPEIVVHCDWALQRAKQARWNVKLLVMAVSPVTTLESKKWQDVTFMMEQLSILQALPSQVTSFHCRNDEERTLIADLASVITQLSASAQASVMHNSMNIFSLLNVQYEHNR